MASIGAIFLIQADGTEFAAVFAVLEFAFELPIAIPGAGDPERNTQFGKDCGKPAAEAIKMTRRARIKIVGKAKIVLRVVQWPVVVQ